MELGGKAVEIDSAIVQFSCCIKNPTTKTPTTFPNNLFELLKSLPARNSCNLDSILISVRDQEKRIFIMKWLIRWQIFRFSILIGSQAIRKRFWFNAACIHRIVWTSIKRFITGKRSKKHILLQSVAFYYDQRTTIKNRFARCFFPIRAMFIVIVEKLWMKQMWCRVVMPLLLLFFIFTCFFHSNYLLNWFFNTFGAHP